MLDGTPWLFLGRSEGTAPSVGEGDLHELTMPEHYVHELEERGWTVESSD
jgi:hypothetical protein